MNKFVKISLVILGVLVVVGALVYLKMFVIGNDSYEGINVDKVTVGTDKITIKASYTDSGRAFKEYSYTQVGNELYVTITSVLVSNKYKDGNFEIVIPVKGVSVDNIHLSNNNGTKVIYSKTGN